TLFLFFHLPENSLPSIRLPRAYVFDKGKIIPVSDPNLSSTDYSVTERCAVWQTRPFRHPNELFNESELFIYCRDSKPPEKPRGKDSVNVFYDGRGIVISLHLTFEKKYRVWVYDALGRMVLDNSVEAFYGDNRYYIDAEGLAAGYYYISVEDTETQAKISKPLIILH
ncbi:MAG: T9SS type A sorting domain-containing protein, partial [Bacteroidota bacterium]|nr:T9SS type A sorting domain-containing protein [Bacteroidota bacterium]